MQLKRRHKILLKILRDGFHNRPAGRRAKIALSSLLTFSIMLTIAGSTGVCLAYEVTVNGDTVGYVNNTEVIRKACDIGGSNETVSRIENIGRSAELTLAVVSESSVTDVEQLRSSIIDTSDEIIYGYAVCADGNPVAASNDKKIVEKTLQRVYNAHNINSDEFSAKLLTKATIEKGVFSSDIAFSDSAKLYNAVDSALIYEYTEIENTTKSVPFQKKTVKDKNKYTCYNKVKQKGRNGSVLVTSEKKYIDKVLVSSSIIAEQIIVEPIDEITVKGTKKTELAENAVIPGYGNTVVIDSPRDGQFLWPVSDRGAYLYISSYFGDGRGHKGLDICAPTGTEIFASMGGTVVASGYDDSGYGQVIQIDHGNGYSTIYSHCSALYVSAGQTVKEGDVIALVGCTGNASGSHLHFEIRKEGCPVNPTAYLGI